MESRSKGPRRSVTEDGSPFRPGAPKLPATSQQKEATPRKLTVAELTDQNEDLTQRLEMMTEKVSRLEDENKNLHARLTPGKKSRRLDLTISVPKFDPDGVAARALATPVSSVQNNKNGIIYPPTGIVPPSSAGFITAHPPSATLLTPFTSRGAPTPIICSRPNTHDLSLQLPPPNVCIPFIPLTDEEVIVFFYNSTVYPIVALRLHGRNWGPAKITEVINKHREVKPHGYIRNTCSVKISTSIRRGVRMYGEDWKVRTSDFFRTATDCEATDAINLLRDKTHIRVDYRVLKMTDTLKAFPEGEAAGIFTQSLRWCAENNVNMRLSELPLIAIALDRGFDPISAVSPEDLVIRQQLLLADRASSEEALSEDLSDASSEKTPTQSDYVQIKADTTTDSSVQGRDLA